MPNRHDIGRRAALAALATALAWAPLEVLVAAAAALACAGIVLRPMLGLVAAAAGVPFGGLASVAAGAGAVTVAPVALGFAAIGWFLESLSRRRLPAVPAGVRPILLALAVFVAALGASAWRAPGAADAAFEVARWAELGLAAVLAATLARNRRTLRALLAAVLLAGAIEAILGTLHALRGVGPEAFAIPGRAWYRAYGSFGQPNPFAGYMNMVWPIGVAVAAGAGDGARPERGLRWLALIAATASLAGLGLSWSRGGWLAAAFGAACMVPLWLAGQIRDRRVGRRALGVLWGGGVAAGALFLGGTMDRVPAGIAERLGSIGATFTVWGVGDAEVNDANFATIERVAHWEAAAAMWADRPWLGQGPGHYAAAYARFRLPRWSDPLGHAHNIYLQLLAEGGLAGLAGYLAFLGVVSAFGIAAAARPRTALQGALGLGLAGALAALAFHSLLDNLFVHDLAIHLGLLVGLTAAAKGDVG